MLHSYALSPQVLRRALRRTFWRFQLIATLSFLVFGLYLASFNRPVDWRVALPIILAIAAADFFIIFYNYRQQLRLLYSVRVEIDNSSILYRQLGEEPVRVMRADITGACEQHNGLLIETVDPDVTVLIPSGLTNDGDHAVRAVLDAWVGVDSSGARVNKVERGLFMPGLALGLFVLLFANSLWLIILLGIGLTLYGIYTEHRLSRKRGIPPGLVRTYNMAFSFLIFIILMKSCFITVMAIVAR